MRLSFTIAPGPRQRSNSQIQLPRDSWPHFTVLDSRLPQPGGSGPRIYIPQGQGGPVIPPGIGFPFRLPLRLAGGRDNSAIQLPKEINGRLSYTISGCKAWTVITRSKSGIAGSSLTRGMDVSVRLLCVCVVLCVGSGLSTGWFLVEGVLPTVRRINKLKKRPRSNKRTVEPEIDRYQAVRLPHNCLIHPLIFNIKTLNNWRSHWGRSLESHQHWGPTNF
jgi:hypothetical protein